MDGVTLIARLVLAAIFAVSGVAKLLDLGGSRRAVSDFGVPTRLAPIVGIMLPVVELVLAGALLVPGWAWWASIGAAALLLGFTAAITIQLVRGEKFDCHCFGQLHSAPISRWTLLRNVVFFGIAALIAVQGPAHTGGIHGVTTTQWAVIAGGLLLLAILASQAWLLLYVMQQYGKLLIRVRALEAGSVADGTERETPGLPIGEPAPAFELPNLEGERATLDGLRAAGRPAMLVFADPMCGPCGRLFPEVAAWQETHASSLTIPVISRGPRELNQATQAEHGLSLILLQEGNEVADRYKAIGTPAAVVVDPNGEVASPLALGSDAIRALLLRTLEQRVSSDPRPAVQAGAPEPVSS